LKEEIEKPFIKDESEKNYAPSLAKMLEVEAQHESSVRSTLRPSNQFKQFLQNARTAKV
jgi:hypothetical protein